MVEAARTMLMLTAMAFALVGYADTATPGVVCGFYARNDGYQAQFPFQDQTFANVSYGVCKHSNTATAASKLDLSKLPAGDPLPSDACWYYMFKSTADGNLTFSVPGLTPGASYTLSVYSYEGYDANVDRWFRAVVNDTEYQTPNMRPGVDSGKKLDTPIRWDVPNVVADADGKLNVWLKAVNDNPQFCAAVVWGTSAPSAPDKPTLVGLNGTVATISWSAVPDALAYYVECSLDSATWTPVTATHALTASVSVSLGEDQYYRVVASNGVGVATSEALPIIQSSGRLLRYALDFGRRTEPIGWFMPAGPFIDQAHGGHYLGCQCYETVTDIPSDYTGVADIYKTYAKGLAKSKYTTVVCPGLTPNALYDIRWHTMEFHSTMETGKRFMSMWVNGACVTNGIDPQVLAGKRMKPLLIDVQAHADADGTMKIEFRADANAVEWPYVAALEIFDPAATEIPSPNLKVDGNAAYVRVVPEDRNNFYRYEVVYSDVEPTGSTTGTPLWGSVAAAGGCDTSVATGRTRWYRARTISGSARSAWSEWQSATRAGHSPYEPLRVYYASARRTASEAEGWVWDNDYRVSPLTYPNSATKDGQGTVDSSGVVDPAPDSVYLALTADNTDPVYVHRYTGFDPSVTYRLREHVMETYYSNNVRRWRLAVNGTVYLGTPFEELSSFCGATWKAGAPEIQAKPDVHGNFTIAAIATSEHANERGFEIVPVDVMPTDPGPGRTAFYVNAFEGTNTAEQCELVAERAESALAWTAADLPDGCEAAPRIDSHGFLFAPADDAYTFGFTANGRVRFWLDGKCLCDADTLATSGVPATTPSLALTTGLHEYHLEYLPTAKATCSFSMTWSAERLGALGAPSSALFAWNEPIGVWAGWNRYSFSKNKYVEPPSFAVNRDGVLRLYGAGYDLWGGDDTGTMFFRPCPGPFDLKLHVLAVGGENVHNTSTRFGVMARSTLSSPADFGYSMETGFSLDGTLRGYADVVVDGQCDYGNGGVWQARGVSGFKPPCWLRVERNHVNGKDHYVFSYSKDGEDWFFARTQEVARAQNVYVGPFVCAYGKTQGQVLAWIDVDDMEFKDIPKPGCTIYIR